MSKNVTPRIAALREKVAFTVPEIFSDRACLVTGSYLETQGQPYVVRRAKAFKKILEEMQICLAENELIAGSYAGKPRGCQVYPEYDMTFVINELDLFEQRKADRFLVSEQTKADLRDIYGAWRGNTIADNALSIFSDELKEYSADCIFLLTSMRCGIGHMIVDYPACINEGIAGIREKVRLYRAALDCSDPNFADKLVYYQSVDICCEAMINFAHRFADLAEEQAHSQTDEQRRTELLAIAANCRRVPEFPAENFWQALQSFWFLHLALHLETSGHSVSPGRFDQYMIPFFRQDIKNGLPEALLEEQLHALWLKFFEINKVRDKIMSLANSGYPMYQNLNLGGQDKNGRPAINELSYLCIDATANLRLPQPSLSVRWFYGCPDDFFIHVLKLISLGTGMPALFNDEVLIPNMLQMGHNLEESRNYGIAGCTETISHFNAEPWLTGGMLNALKPLELLIFNGYDPVFKKTRKMLAGPVEEMKNFEEFYEAYIRQLVYYIGCQISADNILDSLHARLCPTPLVSMFTQNCLASGKTNLEGGAKYNSSTLEVVGLPNVADSLAAIDTLVYREKKLSWQQLKDALLDDYKGSEHIQGLLLHHCPKYGNDIDYVDYMANDVLDRLVKAVEPYRSPRGGQYRIAIYSVSAHVLFAKWTGATPDGRGYGEVLADGGMSAAHGRDIEGLIALLNTIAKVDAYKALGSALLNVKLAPELFKGDGIYRVADVIKGYFLKKGQHVQFNVVDVNVLRDAQKNPENYPMLMVRVAGFSVLFTTIEELLQEDVIKRTEHTSGGGAR